MSPKLIESDLTQGNTRLTLTRGERSVFNLNL